MEIRFNNNLEYYECNPKGIEEFVNYIVFRTKVHDFSSLEQIIYVQDLLKEYINITMCDVYDINNNIEIKCEDGRISSISLPYIYSKILQKLNINSKFYYLFDSEDNCYMGRVVYLLKDSKYKITGVYTDSIKYKDDKIIYGSSPYATCFKTPVQADIVTKDLAFPEHDYLFEINFLKQLNKKGLARVEDKYFTELNNISLFIDGNLLFPSHIYLPRKEFIKDVLIHNDIQDIVDKVEEYYKIMDNVIGADEILSAIYNVRRYEVLEDFNVNLSKEDLVDIVVSGKLMFERDVLKEIDNIDCSLFNTLNRTTVLDFIHENNWEEEMNNLNMYNKKK